MPLPAVANRLQLGSLLLTLAAINGLLKIRDSHCPQDEILALVSSFLTPATGDPTVAVFHRTLDANQVTNAPWPTH